MKRFLKRFSIWLVCAFVLYCAIAFVLSFFARSRNIDGIFVWGDSQTVQGIDIDSLSVRTGKRVLSSVVHGSGVYDFLVFTTAVPKKSFVILSFPECALYRDPLSDSNRSGASLWALYQLIRSGFSLDQICVIMKNNNYRQKIELFYSRQQYLYAYADSLSYPEPLNSFMKMFNRDESFVGSKSRAYIAGVNKLVQKQCNIVFVSFPFAEQLDTSVTQSINRMRSLLLKDEIINNYHCAVREVHIGKDSLLFHDLSHMNVIGAERTTDSLYNILSEPKMTIGNIFVDIRL